MKPGIYDDIPNEEYHRGEGWRDLLSSSGLSDLKRSPLHYIYKKWNPEDKPHFSLGSAVHSFILEPDTFFEEVKSEPMVNKRTKVGKEALAQFLEVNQGKTIVTRDQFEKVLKMGEAVLDNKEAMELLAEGKPEVSFVWQHDQFNILCKSRTDWFRPGAKMMVDLKTTARSADPTAFGKSVWNYGYHRQAGWYCKGVKLITGEDYRFIYLVVETEPPFGVALYEVDYMTMEDGMNAANDILARSGYEGCVMNNEWPGYGGLQDLYRPGWVGKGGE